MADITLEKVAVGIFIGTGLFCFISWFIYGVVEITAAWGFEYGKWSWWWWLPFYSSLIFSCALGIILTPLIGVGIINWLKSSKGRKGTKTMVREMYDDFLERKKGS